MLKHATKITLFIQMTRASDNPPIIINYKKYVKLRTQFNTHLLIHRRAWRTDYIRQFALIITIAAYTKYATRESETNIWHKPTNNSFSTTTLRYI